MDDEDFFEQIIKRAENNLINTSDFRDGLLTPDIDGASMGLVAAGFLFARYYLMPRTVKAHDRREQGEPGAAEQFADLHKRSAFLNMVQFIITLVVLVRIVG